MGGCSTHLQEDLAVDAIRLILEDRGEDDGDTVGGGLDVDRFLVAVVNLHELALPAGRLEVLLLGEGALEGTSHGIALQQGDRLDEGRAVLCTSDE